MIKFYYNGIRVNGGKLERATYYPSTDKQGKSYIQVNARDYISFCHKISTTFNVQNDSDSMVDHFETDSFKVYSDSPYYEEVALATKERELRWIKNNGARELRRREQQAKVPGPDEILIKGVIYKLLSERPITQQGELFKCYTVRKLKGKRLYITYRNKLGYFSNIK